MMGQMPYSDNMLATIFRMKESTVTMALQTFKQFGMVEIIDGVITIPNWEKHQSLDKFEMAREKTRERVARHREKQKLLAECNVTSNATVTECNADRIEEDKEKEIERDKRKRVKEKSPKETNTTLFERIFSDFILSESLIEKLKQWMKYKTERKDDYTEQGLRSLLRRIENKYLEFHKQDQTICELIDDSMANNWKGIIFDKLKEPKQQGSFDTDSFFEKAVAKSLGEAPRTAGEDEEIRKKAEELKKRLG